MENNEVMILSDKKFETCSKAFNKELNAILDAQRKGLKAVPAKHERLRKGYMGQADDFQQLECPQLEHCHTLLKSQQKQSASATSAYAPPRQDSERC